MKPRNSVKTKAIKGRWVLAGLLVVALAAPAYTVAIANAKPNKLTTRSGTSKVRTEPKSGLEFIWLPGGAFNYGCEPNDTRCYGDEKPARAVNSKGFWLGKTIVTTEAYGRCVKAGACTAPSVGGACNWSVAGRSQHPINCVDFQQSEAFCHWIGMRLPTEEEWEYAAKGGEARIYPWGDAPVTGALANYCDLSCFQSHLDWTWTDKKQNDGWPYTSPVGNYPAGATKHGILDMAGNAATWTAAGGDPKVNWVRGGGWDLYSRYLRASARVKMPTSRWYDNVSIRCAE